jgi:hypothetical protein
MASFVPPLASSAPPLAAIDGITSTVWTSETYAYSCGLPIANLESSSHAEDSVVCFFGREALESQ